MFNVQRTAGGGRTMTLLGLGVMVIMFMIFIAIIYNED